MAIVKVNVQMHIPLSNGGFAIVDSKDFDYLNQWKWKNLNGRAARNKHIKTLGGWRNGKRADTTILMHRLLTDAPKDLVVDHINGNPLDNRRSNLRICSHAQNRANNKVYSTNKSGYKGVSFDARSNKWYSSIRFMGKTYNLGLFVEVEEAAREYDHVAKQLHGDFAKLNFDRETI